MLFFENDVHDLIDIILDNIKDINSLKTLKNHLGVGF
jgi:hypothetical protein